MRTGTVGLLVIGAVMLVLGLAGLGGIISLSIVAPPGGSTAGAGIAAFNYTTSGNQTLYVTTLNVVPTCTGIPTGVQTVCKTTQTLSFGDGTNTTKTGSLRHVYSIAGTYTLMDIVTFGTAPYTGKSVAAATVALPGPGSGAVTSLGAIAPSFTAQVTGLNAVFKDTSGASGNEKVQKVAFNFGDGKTAAGTPGGSLNHTYVQSGTYAVQEVVTGLTNGITYYAFGNVTLTATNPTNNASIQTFGPTSPGAQALSMAISAFLAVGGLVLLIGAAIPLPLPGHTRFTIILVAGIIFGTLAYAGLGGPL